MKAMRIGAGGAALVDLSEDEAAHRVAESAAMDAVVAARKLASVKAEAARRLLATDWLALRHRDQLDAGLQTSLSVEDFAALLAGRQAIRDASNLIEAMDPIPADFAADGYWPA